MKTKIFNTSTHPKGGILIGALLYTLLSFSCETVDAFQEPEVVTLTEYEVLGVDSLGNELHALVKMRGEMPLIQLHVQTPGNDIYYLYKETRLIVQLESNYIGTFHQMLDHDSTKYLQDHLVRQLDNWRGSPINKMLLKNRDSSMWFRPKDAWLFRELLKDLD